MSMGAALSTAMAALRANQAAMAVISSNVANAQTPGYVARSSQQQQVASDSATSVRVTGVNRELDTYIQSQLRTETSGAAYARQVADVLAQLQSVYGTPGGPGTLENALSNFTTALQSLSGSTGDAATQNAVLGAAKSLALTLNAATQSVQELRSNTEQSLANSAGAVNSALTQIASINGRMLGMNAQDPTAATLMDQRDSAINQLAEFLDLRVMVDQNNQLSIYSGSGQPLVSGTVASQLVFDNHGTLNASTQWDSDPSRRGVGAMMLQLPNGGRIDLTTNNQITSGKIAADLKLRDDTLIQAQTQLDQFAATLASSLSDRTIAGTAIISGSLSGFDADSAAVQPGNSLTLSYTDTATNTQRQVTIVRVDDAAALPLSNAGMPLGTQRLGINFSGGMGSVVSQLNSALGAAGLAFSASGSTLRVTDTAAATASVKGLSATTTVTGLASGVPQLAVFTDGFAFYTGKIAANGSQMTGLAGRLTINSALSGDPTKLTIYGTSPATMAGDSARSDFLYSQLTSATSAYSPGTGLGTSGSPLKVTLPSYLQQFLSLQSSAASSAAQLKQGQEVVVSTLQSKFNAASGVSIDSEMADLIALQNTYAANAHVMSVVKGMMDSLLQSIN